MPALPKDLDNIQSNIIIHMIQAKYVDICAINLQSWLSSGSQLVKWCCAVFAFVNHLNFL